MWFAGPAAAGAAPVPAARPGAAAAAAPTDCMLCMSEDAVVKFSSCRHNQAVLCKPCLERTVDHHFTERRKTDLRTLLCFMCKQPATEDDMVRLLDKRLLDRYWMLKTREVCEADPSFVSCCKGTCTSGSFHEGGKDQPIFTCTECGTRQCFSCRVPYHEGVTCKRFRRLQRERDRLAIPGDVRECPRCHIAIGKEHDHECDKMFCAPCMFTFCFICRVDYQIVIARDNSAHQEGCPFRNPEEGWNGAQSTTAEKLKTYHDYRKAHSFPSSDNEEEDEEEEEEEDDVGVTWTDDQDDNIGALQRMVAQLMAPAVPAEAPRAPAPPAPQRGPPPPPPAPQRGAAPPAPQRGPAPPAPQRGPPPPPPSPQRAPAPPAPQRGLAPPTPPAFQRAPAPPAPPKPSAPPAPQRASFPPPPTRIAFPGPPTSEPERIVPPPHLPSYAPVRWALPSMTGQQRAETTVATLHPPVPSSSNRMSPTPHHDEPENPRRSSPIFPEHFAPPAEGRHTFWSQQRQHDDSPVEVLGPPRGVPRAPSPSPPWQQTSPIKIGELAPPSYANATFGYPMPMGPAPAYVSPGYNRPSGGSQESIGSPGYPGSQSSAWFGTSAIFPPPPPGSQMPPIAYPYVFKYPQAPGS